MRPLRSLPPRATRTSSALPSMSHDEVEADQLAPSHLDGTYHRAAISTAPLCEVRWSASIGQAVASRRSASRWGVEGEVRAVVCALYFILQCQRGS